MARMIRSEERSELRAGLIGVAHRFVVAARSAHPFGQMQEAPSAFDVEIERVVAAFDFAVQQRPRRVEPAGEQQAAAEVLPVGRHVRIVVVHLRAFERLGKHLDRRRVVAGLLEQARKIVQRDEIARGVALIRGAEVVDVLAQQRRRLDDTALQLDRLREIVAHGDCPRAVRCERLQARRQHLA